MAAASVNGPDGWNILGEPFCHQFRERSSALKDPPQLVGDLSYGDLLLFHVFASGVSLRRDRVVYPTIFHPYYPFVQRHQINLHHIVPAIAQQFGDGPSGLIRRSSLLGKFHNHSAARVWRRSWKVIGRLEPAAWAQGRLAARKEPCNAGRLLFWDAKGPENKLYLFSGPNWVGIHTDTTGRLRLDFFGRKADASRLSHFLVLFEPSGHSSPSPIDSPP